MSEKAAASNMAGSGATPAQLDTHTLTPSQHVSLGTMMVIMLSALQPGVAAAKATTTAGHFSAFAGHTLQSNLSLFSDIQPYLVHGDLTLRNSAWQLKSYAGCYRQGDLFALSLQSKLFTAQDEQVTVHVNERGLHSSEFSHRFELIKRAISFQFQTRLWLQTGLHTLRISFMKLHMFLIRTIDVLRRNSTVPPLWYTPPDGEPFTHSSSTIQSLQALVLLHYGNATRQVPHAELSRVSCCDRDGRLIAYNATQVCWADEDCSPDNQGAKLPWSDAYAGHGSTFPLPDNLRPHFSLDVKYEAGSYDENRCSMVLESAHIWVNGFRQTGIYHFLADKLAHLWYTGLTESGQSPSMDMKRRSRSHLIPRNFPDGDDTALRKMFLPYEAELLNAISEFPVGEFDFDDLLFNSVMHNRSTCFRHVSVYDLHVMSHGADGLWGKEPTFYEPARNDDQRFVLWKAYRQDLFCGLGVHGTSARLTDILLLQRPSTRRFSNLSQIKRHLSEAGFNASSAIPDHTSVANMAQQVFSVRFLCAINSGIGNALFLPPNSGAIQLQPKFARRHTDIMLSHDAGLIFLGVHHFKYSCPRNFVFPSTLRQKISKHGLDAFLEGDDPEIYVAYGSPVLYDPSRMLSILNDVKSVMVDREDLCGPRPLYSSAPLQCAGLIRQVYCNYSGSLERKELIFDDTVNALDA